MKLIARGFPLVPFLLVISSCLYSINSYGGSKMETNLYEDHNFQAAIFLKPQIFGTSSRNLSLFTVPQNNSVGTNDIGNAITVISFPEGKISYDRHFRNAADDIGGGGIYIPVIAPDLIGFGQVRNFFLYDFKKKIHREFRIMMSIEQYIERIAIADASKRLFIFEIEKQISRSSDPWNVTKTLRLIDLGGETPKVMKSIPKEVGVTWSVISDKIFLYAREKEQLQVFDMKFEPSNHPLADVIKQNKGKMRFLWIHPHPHLPFAVLSGGRDGELLINWGEGRDKSPHPFVGDGKPISFSPDGNWLVLIYENYTERTVKTYLMPVSEKYPHYLGSPILLLNGKFGQNNTAWTTNPVSFVGSSLDKIYRWDLTNQPHPGSDRKTFHDYIVERDLEKLTKEKRQGLGEKGHSAPQHP